MPILNFRLNCITKSTCYNSFKVCRMQLESFGYNTNDLLFFWLYQDKFGKPEKAIDMGPGLELPQFRILGYRTADCTKKYTSGNYTCIKGKLRFNDGIIYIII